MSIEFIHAMHDLGKAIMHEKWRRQELASSLEHVGFERLADQIEAGIEQIDILFSTMQAAHAQAQSDELKGHEQFMGETLLTLLKNATAA